MEVLRSTLGAALIGNFVAIMLYGITTLQSYTYSQDYPADPTMLKMLVFSVWVIETVHSVFCLCGTYSMFVSNFGNHSAPTELYWSQGALIQAGVIVMFLVHWCANSFSSSDPFSCARRIRVAISYFARRVWMIGSNPRLVGIILVFAVVHLGFGISTYAVTFRFDSWEAFRAETVSKIVICGGLSSACAADLLITGSLFHYLRKRRTAQRSFDSALGTLTFYVVSTGFTTAVLSVSTIATFMLVPHGGVFLGLASIQSKAYANALLANLNARQTIRNRMLRGGLVSEDDAVSIEFTSVLLSGIKTSTRHRGTTAFSSAQVSPT